MTLKNKLLKILIILFFIIIVPIPIYAAGVDGTTIVLNPGHGGGDTGCINYSKGLLEKDLNMKIAKYLEEELLQYYDVKVIFTHDGINFPNDDRGDLAARAMVARNNNADLYASLHINDSTNHNRSGASVYVTSRTELPKYKEGMTILGNLILDKICELGISREGVYNNKTISREELKYKYYDGSDGDYYADIRYAMRGDSETTLGDDFRDGSGISTVLIEHCYINNTNDVQFLDSDEGLKKLAHADAEAIVEYYGLRLKCEVVSQINVDKTRINLLKGETEQITATVTPNTAIDKTIKWTSQNENIAKVDENGNVIAVGIGKTNIVATSVDNHNITKIIPVNVEQYEVKFKNETQNILANKEATLDVTISPSWIENKSIEWTNSNPEVVELTEDGGIIGKKSGTSTITVTWQEQNLSDEITINVIELPNDTKIEFGEYKSENGALSNIGSEIKISDFLNNINISDNLKVEIQTVNSNQEYIGTNTKIIIKEKEYDLVIYEYNCLIYGDVNGDGIISTMDYTLIKNHIMETKLITDNNIKLASDVSGDGAISTMDYTLIKNHIMDIKKITKK